MSVNRQWWMYDNRRKQGSSALTDEFVNGVDGFIVFARSHPELMSDDDIKCPCKLCKNKEYKKPVDVKVDLYTNGFIPNYIVWDLHGEERPHFDGNYSSLMRTVHQVRDDVEQPTLQGMVRDAAGPSFHSKERNSDAQNFFDLLKEADTPLYEGCDDMSPLSVITELMCIKSDFHLPHDCYNRVLNLLIRKIPHQGKSKLPDSFYKSKRYVRSLGMGYEKIHVCPNGCMLYWGEHEKANHCMFCKESRYMPLGNKKNSKLRPRKMMQYFPITKRLQRLYMSMATSKHMTWHYDHPRQDNVLSHPADGEAWKDFDRRHPEFAAEPRNVRLGLSPDGFSPFGQSSRSYSCWPIPPSQPLADSQSHPPNLSENDGIEETDGVDGANLDPLLPPSPFINDERQEIFPDEGDGFTDAKVVRELTNIVQQNFPGPYFTYPAIPISTRQKYFSSFLRMYRWSEENDHLIRQHFERKMTRLYSSNMSKYIKNFKLENKKPKHIISRVWDEIWAEYMSDERQTKVQIQTNNNSKRMSTHSAGSKSFKHHWSDMTKTLGRVPDADIFFIAMHSNKEGRVVNEKCAAILDKYNDLLAKRISQDQDTPDEPIDTYDVLSQAAGGMVKNAIPGMGSLAHMRSRRRRRSSQMPSSVNDNIHEQGNVLAIISALQTELSDLRKAHAESATRAQLATDRADAAIQQVSAIQTELEMIRNDVQVSKTGVDGYGKIGETLDRFGRANL